MDDIVEMSIVIIVLVSGSFFAIDKDFKISEAMDNFCKEKGHIDATDWTKYKKHLWANRKVECDDGKQYFVILEKDRHCVEHDKWGKCKNHNLVYLVFQPSNDDWWYRR